jgi:CheY-like chemotaxis protein
MNQTLQRVLVIDDDPQWRKLLSTYFKLRRWEVDTAESADEAERKAQEALDNQRPFTLATVDMGYVLQASSTSLSPDEIAPPTLEMPLGGAILEYFKSHHPYIACVVVSGTTLIKIEDVLDLRDEYDLDYFIHKDRVNLHLDDAVTKALRRVQQSATPYAIPPRIFVSYRRQTSWGLALLVKVLLEQRGLSVFLDLHSIGRGVWDERLEREAQTCDFFIPILASDTLDSDWVRRECAVALEAGRNIIPLLVDGFRFEDVSLPPEVADLARHNAITLHPQEYEAQIDRLVRWIIDGDNREASA